jgi:hypothetical protein
MSYIAFSTSRASSSSPRCLNLINLDNLVFAKSLCEIYWSIYKFIMFTYLSMCVCVYLFIYLFIYFYNILFILYWILLPRLSD